MCAILYPYSLVYSFTQNVAFWDLFEYIAHVIT